MSLTASTNFIVRLDRAALSVRIIVSSSLESSWRQEEEGLREEKGMGSDEEHVSLEFQIAEDLTPSCVR